MTLLNALVTFKGFMTLAEKHWAIFIKHSYFFMGKYSCVLKCTDSLQWAPATVRHWGQTCMTLAPQTTSCAISVATHR